MFLSSVRNGKRKQRKSINSKRKLDLRLMLVINKLLAAEIFLYCVHYN